MINKRYQAQYHKLLKLAFFTALFFLSLASLGAQNRRYVTEQRFIQRLVWIGDEYAFRYEVVIERNEDEEYREYKREFTASSALVISLPLGNYRYHVIPYDFLDQPGEASDWVTLNVAAPPTISGEPPEPPSLSSDSEKHIDIFLGAAWAPLFPVYGGMQQIFGQGFHASGAIIRFGVFYNNLKWFNPGLELSASWYALNKVEDDDKIGIQTGVTGFNIVAQAWLPNRKMAFALRAGGGFAFQVGEVNAGQYSYSMGSLVPHINLEASFLWLALKQLYAETGVGFFFLVNQNNNSGYLRPWLGVGWQF